MYNFLFSVSSAEIETAAYALLAVTKRQDLAAALPILKWLSQHRNVHGGFLSTQVHKAHQRESALSRYFVISFTQNQSKCTISFQSKHSTINVDLKSG